MTEEATIIVEGSRERREDPADHPVAVGTGSGSLLQAITQAVSLHHVDLDKVERLYAMHKEVREQEAKAAFFDAMARAQSRIQPVVRNRDNDHTRSTYADIAAVCDAIVPLYTSEGLAVSFDTVTKDETDPIAAGEYRTVAIVTHRQGHQREYHIDLALDDAGAQGTKNKTKVQAKGSTTSYGRRYLLLMIFNVSTKDDDDGNAGKGKKPEVVPDPEGKKALEACGSLNALQAAWKALTVEQRKTLSDTKDKCKQAILEADKAAAK